LVIAGVAIDKKDEKKLLAFGVKDSKKLSPKRREKLAKEIENIARDIIILRVRACKIDNYRSRGVNLDRIEAMKMAEIIMMCSGNRIYIDSLSQNPKRFKQLILQFLKNKKHNLVVENYLDESVPVVSAASIIAKVERDKVIEEIKKKVKFDFGVGYSHDLRAIKFVEKLIKEKKNLHPWVRKSWMTTKLLQEKSWQKKIKDFFKRIKKI
jgi:ribonuclease HII